MRVVIQRVSQASVSVGDDVIGRCGYGLLILVCAIEGDDEAGVAQLASKISKLRIFKDEGGKMNRSVLDIGGSALVISQFTLAADTSRGNRPGFSAAARPETAERLYELFSRKLAEHGIRVETGLFGADMSVFLVNDGPVTIWMDSE